MSVFEPGFEPAWLECGIAHGYGHNSARDDGEDSSMALSILGFTGSALDESSRAHHRTLGEIVMLMAEVCWKTMQRDMTGTQSKTSHPYIPLLLLFLLIMRHSS